MSRLIDADALMELLTTAIRNMEGVAKFIGAEDDPEIRMEIKAYTDIANGVKDMPTIEPERKIGKWIKKSKRLDFCTEWWYECSECGNKPPNDRYGHPNYLTDFCPNCGVKMIGEEE